MASKGNRPPSVLREVQISLLESPQKATRRTGAINTETALTSSHGNGGRNHMATQNRTAEQISKAIEVLNRQRNPLLRIVNAPKFELASPKAWAVSYQLQGLNIAARQLEETRARYVGVA